MDNQAKDLKVEKDKKRLLQMRKEKRAKEKIQEKKENKLLKKTGSQDCM